MLDWVSRADGVGVQVRPGDLTINTSLLFSVSPLVAPQISTTLQFHTRKLPSSVPRERTSVAPSKGSMISMESSSKLVTIRASIAKLRVDIESFQVCRGLECIKGIIFHEYGELGLPSMSVDRRTPNRDEGLWNKRTPQSSSYSIVRDLGGGSFPFILLRVATCVQSWSVPSVGPSQASRTESHWLQVSVVLEGYESAVLSRKTRRVMCAVNR